MVSDMSMDVTAHVFQNIFQSLCVKLCSLFLGMIYLSVQNNVPEIPSADQM